MTPPNPSAPADQVIATAAKATRGVPRRRPILDQLLEAASDPDGDPDSLALLGEAADAIASLNDQLCKWKDEAAAMMARAMIAELAAAKAKMGGTK